MRPLRQKGLSSTENWDFYLSTHKNIPTKPIKLELYEKFAIYGYPEIFFLIVIITGNSLSWRMGMGQKVSCTVGRAWLRGTQFIWSPMAMTFYRLSNDQGRHIQTSPSPGKMTMRVWWACTKTPNYIIICKNNSARIDKNPDWESGLGLGLAQ